MLSVSRVASFTPSPSPAVHPEADVEGEDAGRGASIPEATF